MYTSWFVKGLQECGDVGQWWKPGRLPHVSVRHIKKAWVLWFLQALWRVIASTASIGTVQTRPAVAVRILRGAARGMSKPAGRSCIPPPRTTSAICFRLENGVQPSCLATASRHGASNLRSRGTSRGCFLPVFNLFPGSFCPFWLPLAWIHTTISKETA